MNLNWPCPTGWIENVERTGPRRMAVRSAAAVIAALLLAAPALAQPVFQGDPINPANGLPYFIPSGAPLFWAGQDEKYDSNDDVINAGIIGDVDLVVRSVLFGGAFPPPATGIANAPVVVAGGASTGYGTDAVFQASISDGAGAPAAGHPLTGPEMNGRGVLLLAFADLDGDGIIGPTASDGTDDDAIEMQEVLQIAGRQVALFNAGQAAGDIAVSLGAPNSAGGLGIVLTAAALTGANPPVFDDGIFISTLLPLLPPVDVSRVIGGNPRAPDPDNLVDVEFEAEDDRWFRPSAGDPVPGEPYAIPLDGSSVSVDLLQARSGTAVGAALGKVIGADFSASMSRRLLAGVAPGGGRAVLEAVDTLGLADDGPGNGESLVVFAADVLGNPTDPPPGGLSVELVTSASLRIVSPDSDGDPHREMIALSSAAYVPIVVDDAGVADDGGSGDLQATVDGVPTSVARLGSGGPPAAASFSLIRLGFRAAAKDVLRARAKFTGMGLDPLHQDVSISLAAGAQPIYARTFPAGSMEAHAQGTRFIFRDDHSVASGWTKLVLVQARRDPTAWTVRLRSRRLDFVGIDPSSPAATLTVSVNGSSFALTLACTPNARHSAVLCK